jgi:DNA replication protein DnaC
VFMDTTSLYFEGAGGQTLGRHGFSKDHRPDLLVGGTGTGKTHLAIAIARSCIRSGARGRFYNVVDLVNRLETETATGTKAGLPSI